VDDSRRPDALVTAVGILLDWERNVEIRAVAIASRQGKSDPVYSKVTAFSDGSFWTIRADEYVAEYDSHTQEPFGHTLTAALKKLHHP
jgi:hypothetical protein